MIRTRFRPTPYLRLHLGHAWCSWVNWYYARRAGGEFLLCLGDVNADLSQAIHQCHPTWREDMHNWWEDLEWLGMKPDKVTRQSDFEDRYEAAAQVLGLRKPERFYRFPLRGAEYVDDVRTGVQFFADAWLIMTGVVDDHEMGITHLICGMDLISRARLYDYFCWRLGFRAPEMQWYIPILHGEAGEKLSNSEGSIGVHRYRDRDEGYSAEEVMAAMKAATLVDPTAHSSTMPEAMMPNIKRQPVWLEATLPLPESDLVAENPLQYIDAQKAAEAAESLPECFEALDSRQYPYEEKAKGADNG